MLKQHEKLFPERWPNGEGVACGEGGGTGSTFRWWFDPSKEESLGTLLSPSYYCL